MLFLVMSGGECLCMFSESRFPWQVVRTMPRTSDKQKNQDKKAGKGKAGSPKSRKKTGSPLKRSFEQSSCASSSKSSLPATPDEVRKGHQSGFISYMRATSQGKDVDAGRQASQVIDSYRTMTCEQKKQLVVSFFKGGGRKAGLGVVHQQLIKMTDLASEHMWSGYCTPAMIFDFFKVSTVLKPPTSKQHRHKQHRAHEKGKGCPLSLKESLLYKEGGEGRGKVTQAT